jgi:lactate racemase
MYKLRLLQHEMVSQRTVFGGFNLIAAHKVGCEFVRKSALQKRDAPFDVIVTTNSGYPLDLNLYQSVKDMSAGKLPLR